MMIRNIERWFLDHYLIHWIFFKYENVEWNTIEVLNSWILIYRMIQKWYLTFYFIFIRNTGSSNFEEKLVVSMTLRRRTFISDRAYFKYLQEFFQFLSMILKFVNFYIFLIENDSTSGLFSHKVIPKIYEDK